MEFRIANTFTDSLTSLDTVDQNAAIITAFGLQVNQANPGMQFHRIERIRDENFWSVRVNDDIRIVVHRRGDSLMICYVGHHDDAYEWARRRRLETHLATGAAQLVQLQETVQEIVIPRYIMIEKAGEPRPALFAHMSDADLLDCGVPRQWLADVRRADEDDLLKMIDRLPPAASEALFALADGTAPRLQVPSPAGVASCSHPNAEHHFASGHDAGELGSDSWPKRYGDVKRRFNELEVICQGRQFSVTSLVHKDRMQVTVGKGDIHYEWRVKKGNGSLDVALHFESRDGETNKDRLQSVVPCRASLEAESGMVFYTEPFGKIGWQAAMFRIPLGQQDIVPKAAHLMDILIRGTWPLIQGF